LKSQYETELVIAAKKGNTGAFDRLFALYSKRLYYFAYGYLKSREDAEGVVQEVFLRIWRNRKQLKPDLSFKAYLFKIAYHRILEHFRQNTNRLSCLHEILEETVYFTEDDSERLNYQMLLDKVDAIVEQLPPRQKEILIMRKKDAIPVKEIATKLGLSPKTVENHLTEALRKVKRELGDDYRESVLL